MSNNTIFTLTVTRKVSGPESNLEIKDAKMYDELPDKEGIEAYAQSFGKNEYPDEEAIYEVTMVRTEHEMQISHKVFNNELLETLPEEEKSGIAVAQDTLGDEVVTIKTDEVF